MSMLERPQKPQSAKRPSAVIAAMGRDRHSNATNLATCAAEAQPQLTYPPIPLAHASSSDEENQECPLDVRLRHGSR